MSVGQYQIPAVSPYLPAVGRSPAPPHPFSSYAPGVLPSPLDATRQPSSPASSDLREELAQPSRLAQQEQHLLAKQRGVQQMVPLMAGVRPATGAEACRSPVGLGQHRMPFTVPEPRSMSASRAEPKAPPQSTVPEPPPQQHLPPPSSASDLSVGHSTDVGGSFAPGRLEPPRSAAAMLSNSFMNPNTVDLVMQLHQQQQQHQVDLGVRNRFHPVARPGLDAVRVPPPSTAAYSPALPGMMCPPPLSSMTHPASLPNCNSGRESPLVTSTSTLGDLQNETFVMNMTKVLEVPSSLHYYLFSGSPRDVVLETTEETRHDAFEMIGLRKILRVSWTAKKTNEWVLNKAGVKRELLDAVNARKLAYYGHTMRKQMRCLEKEIMQGTMPGAHRRG